MKSKTYHQQWWESQRPRRTLPWRFIAAAIIITVTFAWLATCNKAGAAECPQGVPRCKVLIITPDMEQALVGQNMILDTAEWANRMGLAGAVQFFKRAIETAPAGEVKKPDAEKK